MIVSSLLCVILRVYVGVIVGSLVDTMVMQSPMLASCAFWSIMIKLCQFFPQVGSPA